MQLFYSLSILWHCLSLWLEWKLDFSSPVAPAEFSKFADILRAALSQCHLQIWNNSTGIPLLLLPLFIVMLHDPNNHDRVITHLEPDILECEVKWALLQTKLEEVMEFQWSYFKSWKMMLWKCCTQYANKFGKLSSGQRTGKGQFSFQFQRKAMPKNVFFYNYTHLTH